MLGGSSEASVTKRLAGTIFIIRVISAALAYLSQILLARWMGGSDYGVYVYVWTWVLLLGSMMDFGISASAQKIIPEYRTQGEHALLRGFLSGSRWMTFIVSSVVSALLLGLVDVLSPWIDANAIIPLCIGCIRWTNNAKRRWHCNMRSSGRLISHRDSRCATRPPAGHYR